MDAERQITFAPHGHILTNAAVWSPDGRRIVYDVRSDPAGDTFDGERIETVDVETGKVQVLYQSQHGAKCGVATFSPTGNKVAFILGPERPTPDWTYGPARRRGVMVDESKPGQANALDARDLSPPFTPGALRGGSHVHVFSPDGELVSFTYEDQVLGDGSRNVGVSVLGKPVHVSRGHPRNHDGAFSVLVTSLTANPKPGSNEISRAFEDAWVGSSRAIAFQGHVRDDRGRTISEVFIVELPKDLSKPGDGPLHGTATTGPQPPRGCVQRRLTFTTGHQHPGIQGPRHWLRSSPDGSQIAFLMRDDLGVVQLLTVSPRGGSPRQITSNRHDIASAFTWRSDGREIAHVMDTSVCVTDTGTGETTRLTPPCDPARAPRPEACVFSPRGDAIAYIRPTKTSGSFNQVFICEHGG